MKYIRLGALFILLSGCATAPPAPVYEASRDLPAAEKPAPRAPRPQTHTIRPGETLAEIALEYGLDYQDLALWNGIANANAIYAGEVIRLSPPAASPVASVVAPQKSALIEPARAAESGAASASQDGGAITPTIVPSPPVGETADVAARADAPIKDAPVAATYAYNAQTLDALRAEHAGVEVPSATTSRAAVAAAAPQDVRRKDDVDWSWPATGNVINKFSEKSKGISIAGAKGAPVYAAADGEVVYTGSNIKSYGRLVIIKHDGDYLSAYAHNDKILVKEGRTVARGEQIATIGDSGAARTMLHLEIRKSGRPFDPMQVLPPKN